MESYDSLPTSTLIPKGTVVNCGVLWCERVVCGPPNKFMRYRLFLEVLDDPYKGVVAIRTMWDTAGGRKQMKADVKKLGLSHPEQLCGGSCSERVVQAEIGAGYDNFLGEFNAVEWLEVKQPNEVPGEQAVQPPGVIIDEAF